MLGDRFGSPALRALVAGISLFWLFPYVMLQQVGAGECRWRRAPDARDVGTPIGWPNVIGVDKPLQPAALSIGKLQNSEGRRGALVVSV